MSAPNFEELATMKSKRNEQVRSKLEEIKQKVAQRRSNPLAFIQTEIVSKLSSSKNAPLIGGGITAVLVILYLISSFFFGGGTGIGMYSPLPDMDTTSTWTEESGGSQAIDLSADNDQEHAETLEGEVPTIVDKNFTRSFFSDVLALPFKDGAAAEATEESKKDDNADKNDGNEMLAVNKLAELPKMLNQLYPKGHGLEVGVGFGAFGSIALKDWKSVKQYILLDPFKEEQGFIYGQGDEKSQEVRYNKVRKAIIPFKKVAEIARTSASDGYKAYPRRYFHFIYLDHTRSYDLLAKDLEHYWPKVVRGGVLGGSFYLNQNEAHSIDKKYKPDMSQPKCEEKNEACSGHKGVRAAVEEFAKAKGIQSVFATEDEFPSWYFQKPTTMLSERVQTEN